MKKVQLICDNCGTNYERYKCDVKNNKKYFCSVSCQRLSKIDEFTDFRPHLKSCKYHVDTWKKRGIRKELWNFNITLSDLKS